MADPYISEIRIFAGNFAPRGWLACEGQILPIAQNVALFSLLGTTYGGDGRVDFALPDLRNRIPVGVGQGPGLTERLLGESFGTATVALIPEQLPAHMHSIGGASGAGTSPDPHQGVPARSADPAYSAVPTGALQGGLEPTGGGQPHENRPPTLGLMFIICVQGIFPARG